MMWMMPLTVALVVVSAAGCAWLAARCWLGFHDVDHAVRRRWEGEGPDRGKVGLDWECPRCGRVYARTTVSPSLYVRRQLGPQIAASRLASKRIGLYVVRKDEQAS